MELEWYRWMLHESWTKRNDVPCFGKHASQAYDFYGFKPFYAFLKDFESFKPFQPFSRYSVSRYFVTRYFVTLFSNTVIIFVSFDQWSRRKVKGRASFGCIPWKHSYKSFVCLLFSDLTQLEKAYHADSTCNEHALTSELSPRSESSPYIIKIQSIPNLTVQRNCEIDTKAGCKRGKTTFSYQQANIVLVIQNKNDISGHCFQCIFLCKITHLIILPQSMTT